MELRFSGTDGTDRSGGSAHARARPRARAHAYVYARTRMRARTARGYPPIHPSHPSPSKNHLWFRWLSGDGLYSACVPYPSPSVPEPLGVGGEQ